MGERKAVVIDIMKLIPERGDAITIINHGDVLQLLEHHLVIGPGMDLLELTDADIEAMKRGEITFQ